MAKKHNITFEEVYSIYNSNPSSFYRSTIYTHKCSTESSNFSLSHTHTKLNLKKKIFIKKLNIENYFHKIMQKESVK